MNKIEDLLVILNGYFTEIQFYYEEIDTPSVKQFNQMIGYKGKEIDSYLIRLKKNYTGDKVSKKIKLDCTKVLYKELLSTAIFSKSTKGLNPKLGSITTFADLKEKYK